jgi:hypothetical protein
MSGGWERQAGKTSLPRLTLSVQVRLDQIYSYAAGNPQDGDLLAPRRKARQVQRGKMNYLGEILHRDFPNFAALASLREIFQVSVVAEQR